MPTPALPEAVELIMKFGYVPVMLMFVPFVRETVWSGAVLVIVKLGYVPVTFIPVPLERETVWSEVGQICRQSVPKHREVAESAVEEAYLIVEEAAFEYSPLYRYKSVEVALPPVTGTNGKAKEEAPVFVSVPLRNCKPVPMFKVFSLMVLSP